MGTIIRGIIVGDTAPSDIELQQGIVKSIQPAGRYKAHAGSRTSILAPTLLDIQVNGLCGIDLQSPTLQPEDLRHITDKLAAQGVSRWVPTLITAPIERIEQACHVIRTAMEDRTVARAIPGIHIEGPFISDEDGPRGAHDKNAVCDPDLRLFDRLNRASGGHILYITVAPEKRNIVSFIKSVVTRGVTVALGHHNANRQQINAAVEAGAQLSTHLGNGLASMIHRHQNPLWPQLGDDRLLASFIADLEHLPPRMLQSLLRAKSPERSILVSDSVHIAGLPPGHYNLGPMPVELLPSGRICLNGTDLLAGSSLMLLQGVVNAIHAGGLSVVQAVACATQIPAQALGLTDKFPRPQVGKKADFVLFDMKPQDETHWKAHIASVFIRGEKKA